MNLQEVQVKQQIITEQHWTETACQINNDNYFPFVKYMIFLPEQKFG